MKTVEVVGMKRPVCANCFEYPENCVGCVWDKCAICDEELSSSELYEYRGVYACSEHFDELCEKRDYQRQQVMETTEHSIKSQQGGEWHNGGYKTMKTDKGGNPITKIKEPLSLKEYEDGKM